LNRSAEGEGEDAFRHQCLVRWVIKRRLQDRASAHNWLKGYTDSDGKYHKGWNELHPGSRLEKDVRIQWMLGNRGADHDWREDV